MQQRKTLILCAVIGAFMLTSYLSWLQAGWLGRYVILLTSNAAILFIALRVLKGTGYRTIAAISYVISLSAVSVVIFLPYMRPSYVQTINMIHTGQLIGDENGRVLLPKDLSKASITEAVYTAMVETRPAILFPAVKMKGWDMGGYIYYEGGLPEQVVRHGIDMHLWTIGCHSPLVRVNIRRSLGCGWYLIGSY